MNYALYFLLLFAFQSASASRGSDAVSAESWSRDRLVGSGFSRIGAGIHCEDGDTGCVMDDMTPEDVARVFGPYLEKRKKRTAALFPSDSVGYMAQVHGFEDQYFNIRISVNLDADPSYMLVKVRDPHSGEFKYLADADGCMDILVSGGGGRRSDHIRGKCFQPHAMHNKPPGTGNGMINAVFFSGDSRWDGDLERSFAIHSTNHISKLGKDVSKGCIRTEPEVARQIHHEVAQRDFEKVQICIDGKAKRGTRTVRKPGRVPRNDWMQPAYDMGNGNKRKRRHGKYRCRFPVKTNDPIGNLLKNLGN